jgi:hypothetical protein
MHFCGEVNHMSMGAIFLSLGELEIELNKHALCRPYNIMTVILEIQQSNVTVLQIISQST